MATQYSQEEAERHEIVPKRVLKLKKKRGRLAVSFERKSGTGFENTNSSLAAGSNRNSNAILKKSVRFLDQVFCQKSDAELQSTDESLDQASDQQPDEKLQEIDVSLNQTSQVDLCVICQEDVSAKCIAQPCQHCFDFECVVKWLVQSSKCPTCKTELTTIHHDFTSQQTFEIFEVIPRVYSSLPPNPTLNDLLIDEQDQINRQLERLAIFNQQAVRYGAMQVLSPEQPPMQVVSPEQRRVAQNRHRLDAIRAERRRLDEEIQQRMEARRAALEDLDRRERQLH